MTNCTTTNFPNSVNRLYKTLQNSSAITNILVILSSVSIAIRVFFVIQHYRFNTFIANHLFFSYLFFFKLTLK